MNFEFDINKEYYGLLDVKLITNVILAAISTAEGFDVSSIGTVEYEMYKEFVQEHIDSNIPEYRGLHRGLIVANYRGGGEGSSAPLHDKWLSLKLKEGWRFGEPDEVQKTHPNILPFSSLTASARFKYTLAAQIVDSYQREAETVSRIKREEQHHEFIMKNMSSGHKLSEYEQNALAEAVVMAEPPYMRRAL